MATQAARHAVTQPRAHPEPVSRWEQRTITCQLDARSHCCFELCVVPHSDPSLTVIEQYGTPSPALRRYVEVASRLREDGWTVIDRALLFPAA